MAGSVSPLRVALTAAAVLTVVALSTPAAAQAPGAVRHRLTVVVRDSASRNPLQSASVLIPSLGRAALTDRNGRTELEDLPDDTLRISVRLIGYTSASEVVDLRLADAEIMVPLGLKATVLESLTVRAARPGADALHNERATSAVTAAD